MFISFSEQRNTIVNSIANLKVSVIFISHKKYDVFYAYNNYDYINKMGQGYEFLYYNE